MPTFLDADTADAICTLVFIGYISDPNTAAKVNIQYTPDDNQYQAITDLMKNKLNIVTKFTASTIQTDNYFIAALGPKDPNRDQAISNFIDNNTINYLAAINATANSGLGNVGPYGAYIGGGVTASGMTIIGPSQLDCFAPVYRVANDDESKAYYNSFMKNTNIALNAINNTPINKNLVKTPINLVSCPKAVAGTLPPGNTIKSYHGMIQAMVNIPSFTNSLIFEIALGNRTTKVSSCLPCSLFMAASNSPASSTHLGKGDYWNIPPKASSDVKQAWAQKIFDCYSLGKKITAGKSITKIDAAVKKLPTALENNKDLGGVFLEALTFPNSFTTKIVNTFSDKRSDPTPPSAV